MTGPLFPLFLLGTAFGGISAFLSLVRGACTGEYPQKRFCFKASGGRKAKRGKILPFVFDLLFSFLSGCYLVLYDATVLGGRGRLYHLAAFLAGFLAVRYLFLSVLKTQTERVFRFALDLFRFARYCFFYPVRKCFSTIRSILFHAYLILKRKNDKMRMKRKAKREIARLYSDAESAFLPLAVTEALASGRK